MAEEWIERTLLPQLEQYGVRERSADDIRDTVADLSRQISAAVRDGLLSRQGAREARSIVSDAIERGLPETPQVPERPEQ